MKNGNEWKYAEEVDLKVVTMKQLFMASQVETMLQDLMQNNEKIDFLENF